VAGFIQRWFTRLQAVTHPCTNPAQCKVTSLIKWNALLLRHTDHIWDTDDTESA